MMPLTIFPIQMGLRPEADLSEHIVGSTQQPPLSLKPADRLIFWLTIPLNQRHPRDVKSVSYRQGGWEIWALLSGGFITIQQE